MLHLPRSLHRILAEQAEREGVSLNQYMVSLLSFNAGRFETQLSKEALTVENILCFFRVISYGSSTHYTDT